MADFDVLLLDDDEDLRVALADVISRITSRRVLALASVENLKIEIQNALKTKLAFLDINLGLNAPNGLDAFQLLFLQGYGGRVFFLTGHARNHPLVKAVEKLGHAEILIKPVSIEKLLQYVRCEFENFNEATDILSF